jgi:thiol:disulfide interchange protein
MSPNEPPAGPLWTRTLRRYILGPGLAVLVMTILILNYAGIDPKKWKDDDSASFQTSPEGDDWEPFTASRLRFFQETGEPVLIHVVASWSPSATESRLLLCTDEKLRLLLDTYRVRRMIADVSGTSTEAMAFLREIGEEETPVVVLYRPIEKERRVRAGVVDRDWLEKSLQGLPRR